ncbi:hypothetical protein F3Y22_tig00111027pilonHSYRG00063 [Hibiscus syriacus]|uniref:PUM-HD domain-containing protein n=1 Tax=Hibiscus syriacus TaxID=106335 RepID=A0A6A2Z6N2_HIBSY|nr:hypothetical protein F3Y22_tig00111027pilonHSYRG00063 [Hibiscus syriacus]
MEAFGDSTGFGGDAQDLPVFTNPNNQPFQGHGSFQSQNPNGSQRYFHGSLEECFGQLNLNRTQNLRSFVSGLRGSTMGSFLTRSLPSQNIVRSAADFPTTVMDHRFFDGNIQCSTSTMPFERSNHACPVDDFNTVPLPLMYNQQPVFNPPRWWPHQDRLNYLLSLKELKGQVCAVARDQNGYRFLQKKLDHEILIGEEIELIFMEVKDHLHELMVHQFAHHVVQKLFKASNQELRTQFLLLLVGSAQRFLEVCTNVYGSRTVQKLMERITTEEQRCILLSVLKPIVVTLTNNSNGNHIILQCLYRFSNKETRHVMEPLVDHCIDIATNKSGCCVLQQCLVHVDAEIRGRFLDRIIANALLLSENEFGNYVVQFVLEMRYRYVAAAMIAQLEGSFVALSFNKYGSNVVEKCLKESGEQLSSRIIIEIINDHDFLKVIGHDYGNYVVQSALSVSKGDLRNALLAFIQHHYSFLQSNPFGRRVLNRTKCHKNRIRALVTYANVVILIGLSSPRAQGGLGLVDIRLKNGALLNKWAWRDERDEVWKVVWTNLAPPKVEACVWKTVLQRIPVLAELAKRGMKWFSIWNIHAVCPRDVKAFLLSWNEVMFNKKARCVDQIVGSAMALIGFWCKCSWPDSSPSITDFMRCPNAIIVVRLYWSVELVMVCCGGEMALYARL